MTCATRKTVSSSVITYCDVYCSVSNSVRSTFRIRIVSSVPGFVLARYSPPSSPVSSSLSSESGLVLCGLLDISNPVLDRTHGFPRSSQVVYSCMSHFAYYKFSWTDSCDQVLRPMAPFLAASTITFYLVSKMQDMGVRCTLHFLFYFNIALNRRYSGDVCQGSQKSIRC
jgi:hypothetical protein